MPVPRLAVRRRGPLRATSRPSGRTARPPPRADLPVPVGGRGAARLGLARPGTDDDAGPAPAVRRPAPSRCPRRPPPAGPVFDNLDPSLEHAWHPVALSRELRPGGWLQVRLLGRTWTLRRDGDGAGRRCRPRSACGSASAWSGWRRPSRPTSPLEVPEAVDRRFVSGWLPPVRSAGPAGPLADTLLDATHGPFVHARRPARPTGGGRRDGRARARRVQQRPGAVVRQPGRPGGRHRRAAAAPAEADDVRLPGAVPAAAAAGVARRPGASTTVLFLLQPEDADSTRVYARVLLSAGPGQPLPTPAGRGRSRWRSQQQMLEEDIALAGGARRPPGCRWTCGTRCTCPADRARRRAAAGAVRLRRRRSAAVGRRLTRRQSAGSSAPQAGQRVGGSSSAIRPQAGQTRRSQQAGSPPSSSGSRDPWARSRHRPTSDQGRTRISPRRTTRSAGRCLGSSRWTGPRRVERRPPGSAPARSSWTARWPAPSPSSPCCCRRQTYWQYPRPVRSSIGLLLAVPLAWRRRAPVRPPRWSYGRRPARGRHRRRPPRGQRLRAVHDLRAGGLRAALGEPRRAWCSVCSVRRSRPRCATSPAASGCAHPDGAAHRRRRRRGLGAGRPPPGPAAADRLTGGAGPPAGGRARPGDAAGRDRRAGPDRPRAARRRRAFAVGRHRAGRRRPVRRQGPTRRRPPARWRRSPPPGGRR